MAWTEEHSHCEDVFFRGVGEANDSASRPGRGVDFFYVDRDAKRLLQRHYLHLLAFLVHRLHLPLTEIRHVHIPFEERKEHVCILP